MKIALYIIAGIALIVLFPTIIRLIVYIFKHILLILIFLAGVFAVYYFVSPKAGFIAFIGVIVLLLVGFFFVDPPE